jgi:hypothetical protein
MITKIQSETTYEVQYEGRDFMVTVFQDIQSGIIEFGGSSPSTPTKK